ncbi:NB-ARC domain-containing protein [Streptomyces manipurensis]|uniref:NB-ARC domain-containing protein n=1 Tax=Streptomyces manipurensis TaxID=1077945 RepID=UPI003C6F292C
MSPQDPSCGHADDSAASFPVNGGLSLRGTAPSPGTRASTEPAPGRNHRHGSRRWPCAPPATPSDSPDRSWELPIPIEPVASAFAGRIAASLFEPLTPKITAGLLGAPETRALDRAIRKAAQRLKDFLPQDIAEDRVLDWLTEAEIAVILADAAFSEAEPDRAALLRELNELGYDENTAETDVVAAAVHLGNLLREEIRSEAERATSPLFHRLVLAKIDSLGARQQPAPAVGADGTLFGVPPLPEVFVGREGDIAHLRARVNPDRPRSGGMPVVAVRGWPGIGKSTIAAAVARDATVNGWYPDGVLWAGLSEAGDVRGQLGSWFRRLGLGPLEVTDTIDDAGRLLSGRLRDARALLIVDDAWTTEDAVPFLVGGPRCAALVTTRMTEVAQQLDAENYVLPELPDTVGMELIERLAPSVVADDSGGIRELVAELEGLPLALKVAARLLAAEHHLGWGVSDLLEELHEGVRLLEAQAPADRADTASGTTPTIAALFAKSTDRLAAENRRQFAALGVFAHRPATFAHEAMAAVWQVDDPRPGIRLLVARGLLEPVAAGRFQMHALLAAHARTLWAVK